jgi:hypothetical protein
LVLYDVTTLHFERDDEDELRKAGMSKEHRRRRCRRYEVIGDFPLSSRLLVLVQGC